MRLNRMHRLVLILLLALSGSALALSSDKDQPIEIEADGVDLDEGTQTAIYEGNVELVQGSIRLLADRVKVVDYQSPSALVIATGKEVKFRQLPDGKKEYVNGRAKRAEYEINSEELLLIGNARLTQGRDSFASERIVYDRVKAKVKAGAKARGAKGKQRVKVILGPGKRKQ